MTGTDLSARRRWRAPPYSYGQAHALAQELGVSAPLASVLVRRGYDAPDAARRFLEASEVHDPLEFDRMADAVKVILEHVRAGSQIAVHGDYDVDGVCSTAVAVRTLRALGATVWPRLPDRMEDGYGLSGRTVEQLHARGIGLLLTADCGIGSLEEVALARRLGMDVVVTDHHRPGEQLPDCPVVHPAVCGYPCPELCATGVVYKLCQALYEAAGRDPVELEDELDLVALATVADVVPLIGENRALVRQGLRTLAGTARPGLRALMTVAGVEPQSLREHTIGFVLAPRINAAGRLYRADAALELLLTEDPARALQIARELDAINTERQAVETRILFEAEGQLSALREHREDLLYVLGGEGWHPGVIGIVASRLVERYHRPIVLVALENGRGRGSGRSIPAYDLHAGLGACAGRLVRFGGHRMAAGLELEARELDAFRTELTEHARSLLREEDLVAVERVDMVVPGDAVGLELAEELERLRPFGMGNPGVNLLVPAAQVADVHSMGEGRHARFTVRSAGVRTRAVAFGVGGRLIADGRGQCRHDLIGRLDVNEWRGTVEPRLVLNSLHELGAPEGPEEPVAEPGCAGCACRARGAEWWQSVWSELDREPGGDRQDVPAGASRTVVDLRGRGILGSLSDLLSTGESLAVVCADVSRRRELLGHELDGSRFGRAPATVLSANCAQPALEAGRAEERAGFCLTDHATVGHRSGLLAPFTHVFALDPPPFEDLDAILRQGGAVAEGGFLHLGWGPAEIEFTRRAVEQEYGLRGPLAAIYRGLAEHPSGIADSSLEAALSGEGRHPRPPAVVGRCLRVLVELGLVGLERSSATVRCTIIGDRRVELERSRAFRAYSALHEEALGYLSEPRQPTSRARAA